MKTFATCCAVLFLAASARVTAQPQKLVRVTPGFATVIICPVPPELVTIGNSQQFSIQNSGNYILVKPLVTRGSTNMFIKAGADTFHLLLRVAETPDLEVRLTGRQYAARIAPDPRNSRDGNNTFHADRNTVDVARAARKAELAPVLNRARSILPSYLRTPRRYTYSVKESNVIFALDYMIQIRDKLFMLCTLVNNSKIPYDIGYVRFKLLDQTRSLLFFKKTTKETDLEPIQEFYRQSIKPNSTARLLFIFDKQGFSNKSRVEIKCIEERGRRDLTLEVPGSYVE